MPVQCHKISGRSCHCSACCGSIIFIIPSSTEEFEFPACDLIFLADHNFAMLAYKVHKYSFAYRRAVTNNCPKRTEWLEFISKCTRLPVMATLSVTVSSSP